MRLTQALLLLCAAQDEETTPVRAPEGYLAVGSATIHGDNIGNYDVPRHECVEKCNANPKCEGFVTMSDRENLFGVCQLKSQRSYKLDERSQKATKANSMEFVYVKKQALEMNRATVSAMTQGWSVMDLDRPDAAEADLGSPNTGLPSLDHPWVARKLQADFVLDMGFPVKVESVTVQNAPDTLHRTGADKMEVLIEVNNTFKRILKASLSWNETATLVVGGAPPMTRYVKFVFKTWRGAPGAINITKAVVTAALGADIDYSAIKAKKEEKAARKELEESREEGGGVTECPLVKHYGTSKSTLDDESLSTWASQQSQCKCATVTKMQSSRNNYAAVKSQIYDIRQSLMKPSKFLNDNFKEFFDRNDISHQAVFHYGTAAERAAAANLDSNQAKEYEAAAAGTTVPKLTCFEFTPVNTRQTLKDSNVKLKRLEFSSLKFFFEGKPVDMGLFDVQLQGSSHGSDTPDNLLNDDTEKVYMNLRGGIYDKLVFSVKDKESDGVQVDGYKITTSNKLRSSPSWDPVAWELKAGWLQQGTGSCQPMLDLSGEPTERTMPEGRGKDSEEFPMSFEKIDDAAEKGMDQQAIALSKIKQLKGANEVDRPGIHEAIEYELADGEEHLYDHDVPALCLGFSCLAFTIATERASGSMCSRILEKACEALAKTHKDEINRLCGPKTAYFENIEDACDPPAAKVAQPCVTVKQQTSKLEDHWLVPPGTEVIVNPAALLEHKPSGESHMRLQVDAAGKSSLLAD